MQIQKNLCFNGLRIYFLPLDNMFWQNTQDKSDIPTYQGQSNSLTYTFPAS